MRILSIELSSFRSFAAARISLNEGMNLVVGENNVGKSSLLGAIDVLRSLPGSTLPSSLWPDGRPSTPLELSMISGRMRFGESRELLDPRAFAERFGNHLFAKITWERPNYARALQMEFRDTSGNRRADVSPSMGNEYVSQGEKITFGSAVYDEITSILSDQVVSFPEFRQRPQASGAEVLRSTEGLHVASVLFLLKNGTRAQEKRFKRVKSSFSKIFPGLRLEVTKAPGSPPTLVVEKKVTLHRLPLDQVGGGIAEMIIMLTHISAEQSKVFLLDEPELHLHPHSQRLLRGILQKSSLDNQFIVVTHSPHFIDSGDLSSIILVREVSGRSTVTKLGERYLNQREIGAVAKNLGTAEKEFLFSRRVLLVEGQTEVGALPILAKKVSRGFDSLGVSLVSVGGNSFGLMLKVLTGFQFPWLAICDRDVLMNVSGTIEVEQKEAKCNRFFEAIDKAALIDADDEKVLLGSQDHIEKTIQDGKVKFTFDDDQFDPFNTSATRHGFRIIAPDFEGYLKANGCRALFDEAERIYGTNKVLQGRYVAEQMSTVPTTLKSVILEVTARNFIQA